MKTHNKPAETLKDAFRREAASVTRAGASGGHDGSSASQTFILSKSFPRLAGTKAWLQRRCGLMPDLVLGLKASK